MTLAFVLLMAATGNAGRPPLPNPDQIRFVQERQMREYRAEYREVSLPRMLGVPPASEANSMDYRELREAVDRFVVVNAGKVIDARTGDWLSNSASLE